ncbi:diguanylate cyclase domain-containing protein [Hyphomicrobium sp. LHD-15]|uniref:diguanylate cyclase domain-containing protein n=1 Tax=Hyphomicrobium sp. LHD-15 TaxID=3072142 RepID=UPI00280F8739|nr:diguanylate cyclase [Hyphomicrobium sp. LHD-15]MDQ8699957.1 diguanylate cyclase [Hyphomicrobium sp. LHD-15]
MISSHSLVAVEHFHDAPDEADAQALVRHTDTPTRLKSSFEIAVNNMARGLSMFDAERRLVVCNALYREIYGLTESITAPGTPLAKIIAFHCARNDLSETDSDLIRQQSWIDAHTRALARGKVFSHLQHLRNGRIVLVTYQPMADGGWVDTQEDVTETTQAQDRIAWLARHCPLTEIANRGHFRDRLNEIASSLDAGQMLAVHLVDLDHFKQVNDTLGHAAGDSVLKAAAGRMLAILGDRGVAGRLGGDEFAIIQTGLSRPEQAGHLARRLIETLSAPYRGIGSAARIGASVGIAISPAHGGDTDTLLQKADLALYRVKTRGRGSFAIYDSADHVFGEQDVSGADGAPQEGAAPRFLRALAKTLRRPFQAR